MTRSRPRSTRTEASSLLADVGQAAGGPRDERLAAQRVAEARGS